MANYNLVIGNKFQPYSFERMILPYQLIKELYDKQMDDLDALSIQASIWDKLGKDERDKDSLSYKDYLEYISKLDDLSNRVASGDFNVLTSLEARKLKTEYMKKIQPLEELYKTRAANIAELRKAASDGFTFFDKDYSTMSLDEVRDNPTYKIFNGKNIMTTSSALSSKLSKVLDESGMSDEISKYIQLGATMDDIVEFINNTEEGNSVLKEILNTALLNSGAFDKDENGDYLYSQDIRDKATQYANIGLYDAVGLAVKNPMYVDAQDRELQGLKLKTARIEAKEAEAMHKYYFKKDENGNLIPTEERIQKGSGNKKGDGDGSGIEKGVQLPISVSLYPSTVEYNGKNYIVRSIKVENLGIPKYRVFTVPNKGESPVEVSDPEEKINIINKLKASYESETDLNKKVGMTPEEKEKKKQVKNAVDLSN